MKIDTKFNFGDKFYYIGKYIDASKVGFIKIVVGSTLVTDIVLNHDVANPFYYKFFIEDQVVDVLESTIIENKFMLIQLTTNEQFNFCFSIDKDTTLVSVAELLKQVDHIA